MNILEQRQGAVMVLSPDGPLVESEVQQVRRMLDETLSSSLGRVVLNMAGVPFIDSRGLETLLDVTEEMSRGGRVLKLCATTKTVREILDLTGLVSQFEHFEDVNAAVRSFL